MNVDDGEYIIKEKKQIIFINIKINCPESYLER